MTIAASIDWQRLQVLRYLITYAKDQLHLDTRALEGMASQLQALANREKFFEIKDVNNQAGSSSDNDYTLGLLADAFETRRSRLSTDQSRV